MERSNNYQTGQIWKAYIYQFNPLKGTDIGIKNFEVKSFKYEPKVKEQISKQQTARMAVATAKAKAQEAEQDKLTIEAEGKARVARAEYLELEKKATAIVQAERDKEMAIIKANKKKEMETIAKEQAIIEAEKKRDVAKLDAKAAAEEKKANILRGEGEATRKRLVMKADGALAQKLQAWVSVNNFYAENMGKQKWVADIEMGGVSGNSGGNASDLINLFTAKTAKDIALDMNMDMNNLTK